MSIHKRTYQRRGRTGKTVTTTKWRVRWRDETGANRSQQFDYHADAVEFDAQTKVDPTAEPPATLAPLHYEQPQPPAASTQLAGWLIESDAPAPVAPTRLRTAGLGDSLHALDLLDTPHRAPAPTSPQLAGEHEPAPVHTRLLGRDPLLVTLGDVWGEWFPMYEPTVAPKTAETNETLWNTHVAGTIGALPISDFQTAYPVQQLLAVMKRRGVGNASIRKTIPLVKMVVDAAVMWRLIAFNGTRSFQLGRRVSAKRKRPLVMVPALKVEMIRLLILTRGNGAPGFTAEQHSRRMVALLGLKAYEGLRPAEAYALKWQDFNELQRELAAGERVSDGDEADPKTAISLRRLHVIKPLLDDLIAWRDVTPFPAPDAPIICTADGLPFDTSAHNSFARNTLTPLAAKVEIPKIRPYDLRHTWFMSQIKCGWDLLTASENGGTNPDTVAECYLAQPALQRDLGIPENVESFEGWVTQCRADAPVALATLQQRTALKATGT